MFENLFNKKNRRYWKSALRIIGIIIFLVILAKVDLNALIKELRRLNVFFLIIAISFTFPVFLIRAYKLKIFLKSYKIDESVFYLLKASFISRFFSVITPGQLGDFVKVFYIKKGKRKYVDVIQATFLDRLFDVGLIFVTGLLSTFFVKDIIPSQLVYLSFGGIIIVVFLFLFKKPRYFFAKILGRFIPDKLKKIFKGKGFKVPSKPTLIKGFLLAIISLLFLILRFFFLSEALHLKVNFIYVTFVFIIMSLATYLPISVAGLGTKDAVLIFFLQQAGNTKESVLSLSLLLSILWFISSIIGFILFQIDPVDIKKMKKERIASK